MADHNANTSDEVAKYFQVAKCHQQMAKDYESKVIILKCLLSELWRFAKSANSAGEPFPCGCERCSDLVRRVEAALQDIP